MTKPNSKPPILLSFKRTFSISILTLLALSVSTTGCTTTCKKHSLIQDALNEQRAVLRSIKSQRMSESLASKIRGNETREEAELTLHQSIDALMNSNEAIRDSI